MTESGRSHHEEANRIVELLLRRSHYDLEIDERLSVQDIEADTFDFITDLEVLEILGTGVPMAEAGGNLVPVALEDLLGPLWHVFTAGQAGPSFQPWHNPLFEQIGAAQLAMILRQAALPMVEEADARESFFQNASDFLAVRIAALDQESDGLDAELQLPQLSHRGRAARPGCNFSVYTKSVGLRVHWSGAYRISRRYFGAPTSPAQGVLQAGRYVFGVDGGAYGNKISWDMNAVVTLPGTSQVHLHF